MILAVQRKKKKKPQETNKSIYVIWEPQTRIGTNSASNKNVNTGCPVEKAQWLRALVLAKDSGSIPSAHIQVHHLLGHQVHMWFTDIHAYTQYSNKSKIILILITRQKAIGKRTRAPMSTSTYTHASERESWGFSSPPLDD